MADISNKFDISIKEIPDFYFYERTPGQELEYCSCMSEQAKGFVFDTILDALNEVGGSCD